MKSSLAAVFDGIAGQVVLQEIPTPTPQTGEVLVRVVGCTLCGSDLHSFDGRRKVAVPTILGHEIVGEVVASGDAELPHDLSGNPMKLGDRVTWAVVASCGECDLCQRDLPQKCRQATKYGHEAMRPGRELLGGLAEHCLLVRGTAMIRIPPELPLEVICPSSCATATIAAALENAGDLRNRNLCLFGAGMLGLTASAMARAAGAKEVVCVDPVASRRERALHFGATKAVAPADLAAAAAEVVGDLGFDVILELSGSNAAFHAAWPLLRLGGTLVLVGSVFPGEPVPIAMEQIVRRQLTIRGIHNYAPRHLQQAVDFLAANHSQFPFAELVTEWFDLKDVAQAFSRSGGEAIRIGVRP